ncbi:tetratricopeptide repeat protein [Pelagicoccus sp. SDUM812002]|uniref:tetratricopeptide repeat protein n=1 Tax=Pelagicoccus sp. SDUM812002 TaxID=3041266 RepID=UPI00280EB155|nr:tetratricopeptide repeat protein [Pelagicoccus sp. SDUM812002]MDQ8187716.1 tetratricopeptide repeat protein [Pelagicoccus sp. SDUM812002]
MTFSNLKVLRFAPVIACLACVFSGVDCLEARVMPQLLEKDLGEDVVMASAYRNLWERSGESLGAAFRLGKFYHANAFLAEAASCYEWVAKTGIGESSDRAAYLLACVREAQGNAARARDLLEEQRDRGVDYPRATLRLARLKEATGEDAADLYEACLAEASSFAGASVSLAKQAMRRGDSTEAKRRLLDCLQRDPNCGDAALLLANLYAAAGEGATAQRFLEIGQGNPRHTTTRDPWLEELRAYRYGEYRLSCDADELFTALRFDEAREVLESGLELYPESGDLWVGLAKLEFASDRRGPAFQAIEKAVACEDAPRHAFTIYGDELYRNEDYRKALELCQGAKQRGFGGARVALLEARCWMALGRSDKARTVLNKALEQHRFDGELLEASGDLAREQGCFEEALLLFRKALQARPMTGQLYAKLLAAAIEGRDWAQAAWAVDTLAARLPGEKALPRLKSQYWLARALDHEEAGQRPEWLAALSKAYGSNPASEKRFRQVAARLVEGEEWRALETLTSVAVPQLPESFFVRKIQGVALLQLDQFAEGIASLEAARRLALAQGALPEARRLAAMIDKLNKESDSV